MFGRFKKKPSRKEQPKIKKGKCRIRFKRTPKGDEITDISPECTEAQINFARQMRERGNTEY